MRWLHSKYLTGEKTKQKSKTRSSSCLKFLFPPEGRENTTYAKNLVKYALVSIYGKKTNCSLSPIVNVLVKFIARNSCLELFINKENACLLDFPVD